MKSKQNLYNRLFTRLFYLYTKHRNAFIGKISLKKDLNDDAMKDLRVYYAHAICLYGTEQEKKELFLIREKFKDAEIINPDNYKGDSMDFYLRLVDKCHIVVFSRLLGKVTSGVGKEVNYALKKDKDAYMLNKESLIPIKSPVKFISRQNTRELYLEWRLRHNNV